MRFPSTEGEIGKLAQYMISGFNSQADDFPSPPVSPEELQSKLEEYVRAREAAAKASGLAAQSYTVKDETLDDLVGDMKADLC